MASSSIGGGGKSVPILKRSLCAALPRESVGGKSMPALKRSAHWNSESDGSDSEDEHEESDGSDYFKSEFDSDDDNSIDDDNDDDDTESLSKEMAEFCLIEKNESSTAAVGTSVAASHSSAASSVASSVNATTAALELQPSNTCDQSFVHSQYTLALAPLCRNMPSVLYEILQSAMIARRPTTAKKNSSSSKRLVYMPAHCDSTGMAFVFKGPYQWPAQASLVAKALFRWSVLCDVWRDAAVDRNCSLQYRAHLTNSNQKDNEKEEEEKDYNTAAAKGEVFIVTENASRKPTRDWHPLSLSTKTSGSSIKKTQPPEKQAGGKQDDNAVVDHRTLGLKPFHQWLAGVAQIRRLADGKVLRTVRTVLLHVLFRFVLGIGNLSMNNIVVNHRGEVRGVDFEDDIAAPPQRIGAVDRRTVMHMLLRGGACSHSAEATWTDAVRSAFVNCARQEQAHLLAALDTARARCNDVDCTAALFAVADLPSCDVDEMRERLDALRNALADKRRIADERDNRTATTTTTRSAATTVVDLSKTTRAASAAVGAIKKHRQKVFGKK